MGCFIVCDLLDHFPLEIFLVFVSGSVCYSVSLGHVCLWCTCMQANEYALISLLMELSPCCPFSAFVISSQRYCSVDICVCFTWQAVLVMIQPVFMSISCIISWYAFWSHVQPLCHGFRDCHLLICTTTTDLDGIMVKSLPVAFTPPLLPLVSRFHNTHIIIIHYGGPVNFR